MGSSIAQLFAGHGYRVVLYDINDEVLEKSRKLILINQEALAQSGGLSGKNRESIRDNITFSCKKESFERADFVIEAIIEKMEAEMAGNGRILVRPSGTEPLLRVMAEAPTDDEVNYYVDTIADVVRAEIGLD